MNGNISLSYNKQIGKQIGVNIPRHNCGRTAQSGFKQFQADGRWVMVELNEGDEIKHHFSYDGLMIRVQK